MKKILTTRIAPLAVVTGVFSVNVSAETELANCDPKSPTSEQVVVQACDGELDISIGEERLKAMLRVEDVTIRTPLGSESALIPKAGKQIEEAAHWIEARLGIHI